MSQELIILIAMIAVFVLGTFLFKLPLGISMALSAMLGAIIAGEGIGIRHLVEGTFSYVDTVLVIATAMIFMSVIENSGALTALSTTILEKFHRFPALLLCLIMFVIMFPGMITGSSTAAVLSAGSIMAPVLILMGVPRVETGAIISLGSILGMIAPPVNIPAMIIGGGIDLPYVGFELPLILLTFPLAILFVLMLGYKHSKDFSYEAIKDKLDTTSKETFGFRLYIPIIVVIVLMLVDRLIPQIPYLGMPFIFIIAAVVGLFTGEKMNVIETCTRAIQTVLPVLGILMGVGMFIQVMTLTGVRGLIVTTCLSLPNILLYVAMALSIPLFGAISAFGSSSVLGVPFALAFLAKDPIITAAAISLIAGVGDLMPPTALGGIFAAQVAGVETYGPVFKKTIIPGMIAVLWAVIIIVFSNNIASFIR